MPKDTFIGFREKGREREKEENWCERETSFGYLPYMPHPRKEQTTQTHALSGNWTRNFRCMGWCSNQLHQFCRGKKWIFWPIVGSSEFRYVIYWDMCSKNYDKNWLVSPPVLKDASQWMESAMSKVKWP